MNYTQPQVIQNQTTIDYLQRQIDELTKKVDELKDLVISHENELNKRKVIQNNYADAILSKIEILKNMIKKNMGDTEEFISQHLIIVEGIEDQIKKSGKISDKQFKTLNEIYNKQKRI